MYRSLNRSEGLSRDANDVELSLKYFMKSIIFWDTTRRHIPEDYTLHNHRCENLKSYILHVVWEMKHGLADLWCVLPMLMVVAPY
jgi:hypothetical protein